MVNEVDANNISLRLNDLTGKYYIDYDKSNVLSFTPGGFLPPNSNILHRARLSCSTSYFVSNGESVAKTNQFITWVESIFKNFKKEFLVKLEARDRVFFSHRTLAWIKDTGAVVDAGQTKIILE